MKSLGNRGTGKKSNPATDATAVGANACHVTAPHATASNATAPHATASNGMPHGSGIELHIPNVTTLSNMGAAPAVGGTAAPNVTTLPNMVAAPGFGGPSTFAQNHIFANAQSVLPGTQGLPGAPGGMFTFELQPQRILPQFVQPQFPLHLLHPTQLPLALLSFIRILYLQEQGQQLVSLIVSLDIRSDTDVALRIV